MWCIRSPGSTPPVGSGQPNRSAAASWEAAPRLVGFVPELHESPDGPAAAAQALHAGPGVVLGAGGVGEQFRPVGHPLDQHAGLDVPQPAGERLVAQDVAEQRVTGRRHAHVPQLTQPIPDSDRPAASAEHVPPAPADPPPQSISSVRSGGRISSAPRARKRTHEESRNSRDWHDDSRPVISGG